MFGDHAIATFFGMALFMTEELGILVLIVIILVENFS